MAPPINADSGEYDRRQPSINEVLGVGENDGFQIVFEQCERVEAWLPLGRVCKTWQAAVAQRRQLKIRDVAKACMNYHCKLRAMAKAKLDEAWEFSRVQGRELDKWNGALEQWEESEACGCREYDEWRTLFDDGETWEEAGLILQEKVKHWAAELRAASMQRHKTELALEMLAMPPLWARSSSRTPKVVRQPLPAAGR